VIREIAWGLRESGADGRICTLLESQVEAINAACDQVSVAGLREGVLQAFDHAAQQIAALTDGPPSESNEMATPTADEAIAPAPQVIETPTDVSDDDLFETAAPENVEAEIAPEIEPAAVVPVGRTQRPSKCWSRPTPRKPPRSWKRQPGRSQRRCLSRRLKHRSRHRWARP